MKLTEDSNSVKILKILHESRKRKIFYKIYFKVSMLKMWMTSAYRSNMPMDITQAGTLVNSVLSYAKELENLANEFNNLLESERIDEQHE